MPRQKVIVTAPSRLHFGMLSFGNRQTRQFGGVGAMIDTPGLRLTIAPANQFQVSGPLAERAEHFVAHVAPQLGLPEAPAIELTIDSPLEEHLGLGTGTQLGLSVTAGLAAYAGRSTLTPVELAQLAGRGQRSAVGAYGFVHGGLIVESGKYQDEALSPLAARKPLPADWRFVLLYPRQQQGLSGAAERQAFAQASPVAAEVTAALASEALLHLLPAAERGDFDEFGESLFRYGRQAGLCFAAIQHGAFASPRVADLVEQIRASGVAGVGQSSWGPTVFALFASNASAQAWLEQHRPRLPEDLQTVIAASQNQGAIIQQHAL